MKMQGMVTDALLAKKELFGPTWHKRPDGERTQIVRTLIHGDEANSPVRPVRNGDSMRQRRNVS